MSAGATSTPSASLIIDLLDLKKSQLNTLLKPTSAKAAIQLAKEVLPLAGRTVEHVPDELAFTFGITGAPSWTSESAGIDFGVTASASCTVKVKRSGIVCKFSRSFSSEDEVALPTNGAGACFIEIGIDFSLGANVGGSGSVGGLGISGNAQGSAEKAVVFWHRVAPGALFSEAIRSAFENFVFAIDAGSIAALPPGDLASCTFHGAFSASVDFTYGLGSYKFSAPSVKAVQDSISRYAALVPAGGSVDIGAALGVTASHSDDLTAIVEKLSSDTASLYLLHAERSSAGINVAVQADVSLSPGSLSIDTSRLKHAVDSITGGLGGDKAASVSNELANKLTAKAQSAIDNAVKDGVGSSAAWKRQLSATTLLRYTVDCSSTSLEESWRDLAHGKLTDIFGKGALRPAAGSGMHAELSDAFTFNVHFFNFSLTQSTEFFQKSTAEVTDNGTIRFLFDVGKASQTQTAQALQERRIHFIATVEQISTTTVQDATVSLRFDVSATNKPDEGRAIANTALFGGTSEAANSAQKAIQSYVTDNPKNSVVLSLVLQPSAYRKLSCSEFTGAKNEQPPVDQFQDRLNWKKFHDAVVQLLGLGYVSQIDYSRWTAYNVTANGISNGIPDRMRFGNSAAVPDSFWHSIGVPALCDYYCDSSTRFMNLCDHLHALAGLAADVDDMARYSHLLDILTEYARRDFNVDYSKPAVAAIVSLCASSAVALDSVTSDDSLTCTLTYA